MVNLTASKETIFSLSLVETNCIQTPLSSVSGTFSNICVRAICRWLKNVHENMYEKVYVYYLYFISEI